MDAAGNRLKREFQEWLRSDRSAFDVFTAGVLDGTWYWDLNGPGEGWMSTGFKALLGYAEDETLDTADWWQSNIHAEDLPLLMQSFTAHCQDESRPFDVTVRYRHKDGSYRWVRCRGVAIRNANGLAVRMAGTLNDSTSLKQAELGFHDIFEQAPDGLLVVDPAGRIVLANRQAQKIFGCSREELIGESVDELVPDSVRERHPDLRASFMANPRPRPMGEMADIHARRKDGALIPIGLGLSALKYQGTLHAMASVRDVTRERYAQQAIKDSEARLHDVVDELKDREAHLSNLVRSIPDAILIVNEAGEIEEVNPAAADMFRITAVKLRGKNILDLFPPEVAKAIDVDRKRTGGMDFLKGAVMAVDALRSNGDDFRATVSVNSFRAQGGQKYLWLLKDISVELRYEKERQSLNRALEEKNRELESIIYAASHDMRSPLVNLQGFSRELGAAFETVRKVLGEVELPAGARQQIDEVLEELAPEALGFIDSSSRKMDQLIRGLLKLSRLGREELHLKAVNMDSLVAETLRSLEFVVREHDVDVQVGELPVCLGDGALLSQVFANLIDNAVKYMDPTRKGSIRVSGSTHSRTVEYVVEDNGVGIDPAHKETVFEVFHRLNPTEGADGEGLGLSIVRRILDRHNGAIRVESEAGHGARFVITLPAPRPSDLKGDTKRVSHAGL